MIFFYKLQITITNSLKTCIEDVSVNQFNWKNTYFFKQKIINIYSILL